VTTEGARLHSDLHRPRLRELRPDGDDGRLRVGRRRIALFRD
jgi:hypothetical protein